MTGEKFNWYHLADRLNTPLQELQSKTTSTEFLDWIIYLELEPNTFHRLDYYLAQIAAIIVKVNSKKNSSVKLEDYILNFKSVTEPKKLNWKERMKRSKDYWKSIVGLKK